MTDDMDVDLLTSGWEHDGSASSSTQEHKLDLPQAQLTKFNRQWTAISNQAGSHCKSWGRYLPLEGLI